ncbi:MAG: 33 kDa chaperonin HslO, partial [uncultured Gemmatimonadetes bacterium]
DDDQQRLPGARHRAERARARLCAERHRRGERAAAPPRHLSGRHRRPGPHGHGRAAAFGVGAQGRGARADRGRARKRARAPHPGHRQRSRRGARVRRQPARPRRPPRQRQAERGGRGGHRRLRVGDARPGNARNLPGNGGAAFRRDRRRPGVLHVQERADAVGRGHRRVREPRPDGGRGGRIHGAAAARPFRRGDRGDRAAGGLASPSHHHDPRGHHARADPGHALSRGLHLRRPLPHLVQLPLLAAAVRGGHRKPGQRRDPADHRGGRPALHRGGVPFLQRGIPLFARRDAGHSRSVPRL